MFNFDADIIEGHSFYLIVLRETCGNLSIVFKNTIFEVFYIYLLSTGIVRYKPLRQTSFLPTPKELKNRLALVSVNNSNKKCFLW